MLGIKTRTYMRSLSDSSGSTGSAEFSSSNSSASSTSGQVADEPIGGSEDAPDDTLALYPEEFPLYVVPSVDIVCPPV